MARDKRKETLSLEERLQAALVPDWEWPYKLPKNWCWTRISSVTQILNGFAFKSQMYTESGIRIIRISNVQDGYIEDEKPVYYPLASKDFILPYMLQNEDLLMSLTGNVGRVAIIDNSMLPAVLNQRVACIRTLNSSCSKYYLFYYFLKKEFVQDCIKNAKGSAQLNMSTEWLKQYPLPLPPLFEQQRIVDRIESLFARLEEAKQKAQDALDSFETRKAAILHKAFAGELTARWRKEHGIEMESWDRDLLKNIVTAVKDKFDPTTQTTSLRYIGLEHIQKNHGIVGFGTADDIKSLKTIFKTGDILYGKLRPYLNKHGIAQFDGICSTDILVYRTQYPQTAKYINYFMDTEWFISTAVSKSKGINLPRVSEKEIGNILVNVPLIAEQTEIVRVLDDLFAKERQVKEAAEAVLRQIDLIKKAILARAFRGELGTNDPAEGSALELVRQALERVGAICHLR